jgi:hypothetical protein
MKCLAFATGLFALGFAATTPARADFAVIQFGSGTVRSGGTAATIRGVTPGERSQLVCPIGQRPRSRSTMPARKVSVPSASSSLRA